MSALCCWSCRPPCAFVSLNLSSSIAGCVRLPGPLSPLSGFVYPLSSFVYSCLPFFFHACLALSRSCWPLCGLELPKRLCYSMHSVAVLRSCNLFQFPYALLLSVPCSTHRGSPGFTWPGALAFQQKTMADMFSEAGKKSNVHPISVSLGPDRIVRPGSSVVSSPVTPASPASPDISPLGLQHAGDSNSCARREQT